MLVPSLDLPESHAAIFSYLLFALFAERLLPYLIYVVVPGAGILVPGLRGYMWYFMCTRGHLLIGKNVASQFSPRLLLVLSYLLTFDLALLSTSSCR